MSTDKERELNETMFDCYVELEKGIMAINNFLNEYDYNVKPTAMGAMKYGSINARNLSECTLDDEIAYKILNEYENMMWFIHVARDYCDNAIEQLRKKIE